MSKLGEIMVLLTEQGQDLIAKAGLSGFADIHASSTVAHLYNQVANKSDYPVVTSKPRWRNFMRRVTVTRVDNGTPIWAWVRGKGRQ